MGKALSWSGEPIVNEKPLSFTSSECAVINSIKKNEDNSVNYFEIKLTPLIFCGNPSVMVAVRDVTQAEYVKRLEKMDKERIKLLASISHEFRTPLNGIMSMIDAVNSLVPQDLSKQYLLPAYNSSKLLLSLVNDILDIH